MLHKFTALMYLLSAFTHVADILPRRRLCSASTDQLQQQQLVPSYWRSTIVRRAFPIAGARIGNGLPSDVTSAPSLAVFGRRLKTRTFRPLLQYCLTVDLLSSNSGA